MKNKKLDHLNWRIYHDLDELSWSMKDYLDGFPMNLDDIYGIESLDIYDEGYISDLKSDGYIKPNERGFKKETIENINHCLETMDIASHIINHINDLMTEDITEEEFNKKICELKMRNEK